MSDNQWGEIFNLTEELRRIEEEVDRRLEETLAEDPHVIEQETVHYGAASAAADRAESLRMRQSVPLFEPISPAPVANTWQESTADDEGQAALQEPMADDEGQAAWQEPMADDAGPDSRQMQMIPETDAGEWSVSGQDMQNAEMASGLPAEDLADEPHADDGAEVHEAAAAWNESPVDDYNPPMAAASPEEYVLEVPEDDASLSAAQETIDPGVEETAYPEEPEETAGPWESAVASNAVEHRGDLEAEPSEPSMESSALATEPSAPVTGPSASAMGPSVPVTDSGESVSIQPGHRQRGWQEAGGDRHQLDAETAPEVSAASETAGNAGGALSGILADRRKVLAILVAIVVILAGVLGYRYYQDHVRQERQYTEAETLYESGDYDGALAAFEEIRHYKDVSARILEVEYAKASALVDQKAYAAAIEYVDNLSAPTDAMLTLRTHAIYELAMLYYKDGDLENAAGELMMIQDEEIDDVKVSDLLHEIRYQQAADALAVYDFDTAEPILAALGDYEDAASLLAQVENAIDVVYTDVARDDSGKEIAGKTEYLWVHSVITPGAAAADDAGDATESGSADDAGNEAGAAENAAADDTAAETADSAADNTGDAAAMQTLRELAGATDAVDDEAVHVLMMHLDTTDAEMTYEDAEPIETDSSTIMTKDISSYAAIDDTFGKDQTVFSPQVLQRSNTDYALAFTGSEAYAGKDRKDDEVVMECKMADDAYWAKTRRVYAELEDDKFIGVSRHQLRTWTRVLNATIADEVRAAFLSNSNS